MKLKFDKQTLKDLALEHFEKAILVPIALFFVIVLYSSVTRATYNKSPEELAKAAESAKANVDRSGPNVLEKQLEYPNYLAELTRGWKPAARDYEQATYWNPPLFPERRKRTDPKPFPVRDLVGTAEVGAVSVSTAPAAGARAAATDVNTTAESVHGARWIVLTGLVPLADQQNAYKEAFKDNSRPEDRVVYLGCVVERAAVLDDKGTLGPVQSIPVKRRTGEGARSSDLVAPSYVEDTLTAPLLPLVGRGWGKSVVHEPEITASVDVEPKGDDGDKPAPKDVKPDVKKPEFDFGATPAPAPDAKPEGRNAPVVVEDPRVAGRAARGRATPSEEVRHDVPFLLFRYFDTTVESGVKYKYRVALALANPNKDVEDRLLANPKVKEKPYLLTEFTPWTDPIAVPRDDRLLFVGVKPAAGAKPAEADIRPIKWLKETGNTVWSEKLTPRGQLTAFLQLATKSPQADSTTGSNTTAADSLLMPAGRDTGKPAAKKPERKKPDASAGPMGPAADFLSNMVVLDFRGGDKIPNCKDKQATKPGEIILLDPDGTIVVRNELDDEAEFQRFQESQVKPDTAPVRRGAARPAAVAPGRVAAPSILDDDPRAKGGRPKPKRP